MCARRRWRCQGRVGDDGAVAAGGVDDCFWAVCEFRKRATEEIYSGDEGGAWGTLFAVVVDCRGRMRLGDHD